MVLVAGVVVMFAAAPASAQVTCTETPAITNTCHFKPAAKALIQQRDWAPATTSMPPGGATWETRVQVLERARRSARIVASLRTMGLQGLIVGAGIAGAERALKMTIPGQDVIYRAITGDSFDTSSTPATFTWAIDTLGGNYRCYQPTYGTPPVIPSPWSLTCGPTPIGGEYYWPTTPATVNQAWTMKAHGTGSNGGPVYCMPAGSNFTSAAVATLMNNVAGHALHIQYGGNLGGCSNPGMHRIKIRTDAEMEGAVVTRPITSTQYANYAGTKIDLGNWTAPTINDDDWENAEIEFGLDTGEFTLAQQGMLDLLAGEIDPDWIPDEFGATVFDLLAPNGSETYDGYIARLREGGWTGTAVVTELSPAEADEACGPGCVVRVRVPDGAGGTTTYSRTSWPSFPPSLSRDIGIRFIVNPPGVPVVIPPPAGLPGGGDCDCPPIDLSPLEVGATEKFPFGGLTWVHGFVENAMEQNGGELPKWEFTKASGNPGMIPVQIPENEYRHVTDPLFKIIIVVMSLWFAFAFVTHWNRGETS